MDKLSLKENMKDNNPFLPTIQSACTRLNELCSRERDKEWDKYPFKERYDNDPETFHKDNFLSAAQCIPELNSEGIAKVLSGHYNTDAWEASLISPAYVALVQIFSIYTAVFPMIIATKSKHSISDILKGFPAHTFSLGKDIIWDLIRQIYEETYEEAIEWENQHKNTPLNHNSQAVTSMSADIIDQLISGQARGDD